ncbi:hypothetical protein SAMN05660493_01547 [Epilithonimonas bovis DSM 19482]|uniref:Uncharacterized protein n=1 Tax=Epilithonimonas bovis DSM 19482 TaxID=1121284 RepID=A0A1U7PY19_9FLAO|nr:hypothetical protein [Epilithonimonas bovis]SIT96852.1 hypothetical protein SAMN05660493_01547 [Epilithonimonas bovis DSM 19482]
MKQIITILLFFFIHTVYHGQSVKKLNDPAIVSQEKRAVFESWGDWRPYPKYNFLGIQTNFAYATVWGMWSPRINQDYKDGADLRPLKPNGTEVQRLATVKVEESKAEQIKTEYDTIYKRNIQDFAHWTATTVDADPLWLLYYKTMLRPLNEFPDDPQTAQDWGIIDPEVFKIMQWSGKIDRLKEKLDLLKEKYKMSRTMDMPRGKRFLMYHETLIGWRELLTTIRNNDKTMSLSMSYKKKVDEIKKIFQPQTDREIVASIMTKYKNQF